MDKYLKKLKPTDHGHCIIKEELIISDSDGDENDVKAEPVYESIHEKVTQCSDSDTQSTIIPGARKRKRTNGHFDENIAGQNKKQASLDSFFNTKTPPMSNEQTKNLKSVTTGEELNGALDIFRSYDMDILLKKVTKAYCGKCKVKSVVKRGKARCRRCETRLTYHCENCNRSYRDFTKLSYHLEDNHAKASIVTCSKCDKTFNNKTRLVIHQKNHCHSVGQSVHSKYGKEACYKCKECSFATHYRAGLSRHVRDRHSAFEKKCDKCNKIFKSERALKRHMAVYCNKAKRLECHHCGHKFYRKDQILIHLNQVHFKGSLATNKPLAVRIGKYCDTALKPFERMKEHFWRCESAPLELRHQIGIELLNRHERIKISLQHSELARSNAQRQNRLKKGPRTCKHCGVILDRCEHLRYHLERCEAAPSDDRQLSETADQPDLDTALKNLSTAHCVNCETNKPVKKRVRHCKKCETTLKFICQRCPKSYRHVSELYNHLRINHVKIKEFHRCNECRRSYRRLKDLKMHQETQHSSNTVTKIYKCSKCDKSYSRDASLRHHLISCGEEPKFYCDKCPFKTHFKSTLVNHIWAKRATCI